MHFVRGLCAALGAKMSESFLSIKSNASDRELVLLSPRPNYFVVELRGVTLSAVRKVCAYTDAKGLSSLFSRLAAIGRPWVGVESWQSLEGGFSISAQCSALGHVSFSVVIRDQFGGPEEWSVSACITTDLGQLSRLATDAQSFFSAV
jgi:hypothetical protein